MNETVYLSNGVLVTLEPTLGVIEKGALLCRDGLLVAVGREEDIPCPDEARRLDAEGRLVTPGLINAHMHFYGNFARGMPPAGEPPANFVQILERLWWRLDKGLTLDDVYWSAVMPLLDGLRCGVTTVFDHHASPHAIEGSLDQLARACQQVGVRACLCYEVSDRDGPETAHAGIGENVRFLQRCQENPQPDLAAMMGLHASFTLSQETLEHACAQARSFQSGVHVHVAEDRADQEQTLQRDGLSVVRRLVQAGGASARSLFVHCVHTDEEEAQLLAQHQTWCVHNPQSNMNNAVGGLDLQAMIDKGVPLALGTDGMSANVLDEMRAAQLRWRHDARDPRVGWTQIPPLLLENNRKLAQAFFGSPLGVLAPGALADCVIWDQFPLTPLDANNFYGHLLFGLAQARAHTVLVGGNLRLQEGRFPHIDPAQVAARSREQAQALWQRLAQS